MLSAHAGLRLVRNLRDCKRGLLGDLLHPSVGPKPIVGVTIGNFDGLHLGHQALFRMLDDRLKKLAAVEGARALKVLLTFAPHPKAVLQGIARHDYANHPELWQLTSLREKLQLLSSFHFDLVFVARFQRNFAAQTPEQFIERYLVDALRARVGVVGHDWSFGRDRAGGIGTLEREGIRHGFDSAVVPPQLIDDIRVSSSEVRTSLAKGDLATVSKLLGRDFAIESRVQSGEQRGRSLGFPTANLMPAAHLLPADGVYATWVEYQRKRIAAVTNIGVRPTFGGGRRVVEVHLIDYNADLYGQRLRVTFVDRLRNEQRFSGVEELKAAIVGDIDCARRRLFGDVR